MLTNKYLMDNVSIICMTNNNWNEVINTKLDKENTHFRTMIIMTVMMVV